MEVNVSNQTKKFWLALEKWEPVVGHEISIGEYKFCAIPLSNRINVSEVTTGAKFFELPIDPSIHLLTESKESAIKFFYTVGETIKRIIDKQENFDKMLSDMKKVSHERLGEMPPIEDIELNL